MRRLQAELQQLAELEAGALEAELLQVEQLLVEQLQFEEPCKDPAEEVDCDNQDILAV